MACHRSAFRARYLLRPDSLPDMRSAHMLEAVKMRRHLFCGIDVAIAHRTVFYPLLSVNAPHVETKNRRFKLLSQCVYVFVEATEGFYDRHWLTA